MCKTFLSNRKTTLVPALALVSCLGGTALAADVDQDGIDDAVERSLLARFTPQLRFTTGEQYRPMDARQYIQWSELQSDGEKGKGVLIRNSMLLSSPGAVLSDDNNITKNFEIRVNRFLSPMDSVPQPGQWARHGWDWSDVMQRKNVGLYGHVVPIKLTTPQTDFVNCRKPGDGVARDTVLCGIDGTSGRTDQYYKVEYWQFFGYNGVGKPFDLGDHEGDWCSVQVVVDAQTQSLVQVHHFFHGRIAAYDVRKFPNFVIIEGGNAREYRGPAFPMDVSATWHSGLIADAQNRQAHSRAQDNLVRIARDPGTGQFTHPVVYVERGGHEFWPTNAWGFQDSPEHNGDDAQHRYIAATPPNLGEVEHPLNETPDAHLILQYNGRWGAYSRKNSPPQGPALHDNWTWPVHSSVRWQLPTEMGF